MANTEHVTEKECEMSDVKNYFATTPYAAPVAAAPYGGGFGLGGGDGGLLALALLGGGGLGFGGRRDHDRNDCASTDQLQTATGSIIDAGQNNQIMGMLQGIATSIPVAEGNVQLALAQATGQLSNQINTNLVSNTQGFANTQLGIATATASIIAVGEAVKDTVNATSAATQLAIANSVAQGLQNTNFIVTQVRDDGDKTRALLVAQNENALRDANTALQIRLSETQAEGRARGTEVNVSQVVNQAQAQAQAQQQQQQLIVGFNQLCGHVMGLQNAVATQSNMIIGNTGATTTGTQTANPINVRT